MKPHIKYGLHTAAAMVLINLAFSFLMKNPMGGNFLLTILVFGVAQFFALREWKHKHDGWLSFNKGFGYSLLTALIGNLSIPYLCIST